MSGKPNQKFKTVFADVLNMVRLLAMYFGLYILSYLALSSTALKGTSAPVGLISLGIAGGITFICLPKDHRKFTFAVSGKILKFFGIILLSTGLTLLLNRLMNVIPWDSFLPKNLNLPEQDNFTIPLWLALLGYGVLAPFSEEVCFRGILYPYFAKWMKAPVAVLLSALLFALYHMNLVQGIYAFVMGAVMAAVVHKTKALSASILFHMTSNLLVTLYSYQKPLYDFLVSVPGLIVAVLAFVAGLVLILTGKKESTQ